MKWFRWHHDSCEDAKFRLVARNAGVTVRDVIALWAALLESASRNDPRGTVPNNRIDFIEAVLDLDAGLMDSICAAMEDAELIQTSEFELKIVNWSKRQFDTDLRDGTNAERQKRYREKKRVGNGERNGTVTPQIQITDTEKKEAPVARTAKDELTKVLDSEHAEAVIEHRKKKRAPLTAHAAKLLAARFAKWPKPNEAADAMIANGWQGFEVEWMQSRKQNGPDPPVTTGGPPPGFREAKSTGEYVAYMREKLNDPKIEQGDWRLSKWQHVPVGFTPIRKVSA